ncbi:MAG: hypothetical protein HY814_01690 [Candidatus Riflebacteria bacterium]|nr:hypothetical protein [Candidatus Riflebacteria bacterium]
MALVSGAIANKPYNSGATWTRLNYVLGLRRLGFEVYFVEQIATESCTGAQGEATTFGASVNRSYFQEIVNDFDLDGRASLLCDGGRESCGPPLERLVEAASDAELLVNISGHLTLPELICRVRTKVYVDLDPGFTQLWVATGNGGARLEGHDYHFTVGENLGTPACSLPTCGLRWRPTRPPVVLEQWPVVKGPPGRFTTIASWRGPYGPIEHEGKRLGLKVHEFRKVLDLPARSAGKFELALEIHAGDRGDLQALGEHGWTVVEPRVAVPDPAAFRRYVQGSGAEFSVAQGIYVDAATGWFSDRTVRYLASGKPALVQETGFSANLPAGEGLLAFRDVEEAARGVARILADYDRHCHAARALAEKVFDSDVVLGALLDEIGLGAGGVT